MNNFMESLKIMAVGMAGIYAAAIVLAGMMKALTALFPGTKSHGLGGQSDMV